MITPLRGTSIGFAWIVGQSVNDISILRIKKRDNHGGFQTEEVGIKMNAINNGGYLWKAMR